MWGYPVLLFIGCLFACLVDWLVSHFVCPLFGLLVCWLGGWVGWLAGWLWLVDELFVSSIDWLVC